MPRVSRKRVIAAPRERVWELVSDPHHLPRWWPRTVRVEDVRQIQGGRRSRWTTVLGTQSGRGGGPEGRVELDPTAMGGLGSELGGAEPAERARLEEVVIPAPHPLPPAIAEAVGPAAVLTAREHRVRRAAGRGYPDLVRLRGGR